MTYNIFSELPIEERDEMVADVMKFLMERGYVILAPGGTTPTPETRIDTLDHHDRAIREQAFLDAAEIVMNGHGGHMTPLQLAVKLKNIAGRVRAGGLHEANNTI